MRKVRGCMSYPVLELIGTVTQIAIGKAKVAWLVVGIVVGSRSQLLIQ